MLIRACVAFGILSFGAVAQTVDYERQVRPIVAARCSGCHNETKRSGGLALASLADALAGGRSGAAIRPGKGSESLLVERLTAEGPARMPFGGKQMPEAEIALVKKWIDEGARATLSSAAAKAKWEASLSLSKPAGASTLDGFLEAYWAKNGVREGLVVGDGAFARRAYLDIWGLLPPPAELAAFVADGDAGKREKLVGRLLGDNRKYAEHWISFWNDLLRNDEGANYHSETGGRKSITPWLLQSLETNLSYRELVAKLLNPTAADDPEGFLIGVNWRGTISASQTPAMQAAQNTAQVFLGVNLKCNSCHDSFISKWKLKDAYQMAAYFAPEPKLQLFRCDVAQDATAEAGFLYPALYRAPASSSLKDRRAAAAATFTDPGNGRLARTVVNRIWERMLGRGFVADSDDLDGEPWDPETLDYLAADFVEHGYDLKRLIGKIAVSKAYQLRSAARKEGETGAYVFRGPEIRRLTAEEFADAVGAITGEWHVAQPGMYTREWRMPSSPLTRALGRPIRDQVYSSRDTQATTLQALELVNGEALTHWLTRGAKKLLGELPAEPVAIFDKSISGNAKPVAFDLQLGGAGKVWLLVYDRGSYSPEKMEAVWRDVELVGPGGTVKLGTSKPLDATGLREGSDRDAVRVKTPSKVAFDVTGYTSMRGTVGIENKEITSDLNPQLRLFVFTQEPNMERLTAVGPELPLPAPAFRGSVVDWVFGYALGRGPTAAERSAVGAKPLANDLADLLWAVMMKPEFQLIY